MYISTCLPLAMLKPFIIDISFIFKFRSFVGGIMKGFDSNYISTGDAYVIIEADEYDRSFLALDPDYSLITSIEKDHLDVYDRSK